MKRCRSAQATSQHIVGTLRAKILVYLEYRGLEREWIGSGGLPSEEMPWASLGLRVRGLGSPISLARGLGSG